MIILIYHNPEIPMKSTFRSFFYAQRKNVTDSQLFLETMENRAVLV